MWIELDEERFKPEIINKIYELVNKGKIEELINNAIEKIYIDDVNSKKENETIVNGTVAEEEYRVTITDNNEIKVENKNEIIERLRELETRIEKIEKIQHKNGGEGEEGEKEGKNKSEKEWDSEALSIIDNLMDI